MKKMILLTAVMSFCGFIYAANIAEVNGTKITESQLQERLYNTYGPKVTQELIIETLFKQKAKELKIKADKKEVNKRFKKIKSQYQKEEDFKKALKERRLTETKVKEQIQTHLLSTAVTRKVENISITDKKAKEFFDKNKAMFETPEKAHLKQIVVKTKEAADEIAKDIKEGKKFEELAKEKSLDKPSGKKGGDIGMVARNQLLDDIAKKIFTLKKGEVSGPIETPNGYYLLKVEDKKPKIPAKFAKVKKSIKSNLLNQETSRAVPKVIEMMKKEAKIVLFG
jgi:foldase protein PrsA